MEDDKVKHGRKNTTGKQILGKSQPPNKQCKVLSMPGTYRGGSMHRMGGGDTHLEKLREN